MINHEVNKNSSLHKPAGISYSKFDHSPPLSPKQSIQKISHNDPSENTQSVNKRKITALPSELISNILINLDKNDLLLCRKVNRTWQTIIDEYHLIARSFSLDNHYYPSPKAVERYRSFVRSWLITFGCEGEKLIKQLDQFLEHRHFPEMLFHGTANLLSHPKLTYKKVFETNFEGLSPNIEISIDSCRIMKSADKGVEIFSFHNGQWQREFFTSKPKTELDHITCATLAPCGHYFIIITNSQAMSIWGLNDQGWALKSDIHHDDPVKICQV